MELYASLRWHFSGPAYACHNLAQTGWLLQGRWSLRQFRLHLSGAPLTPVTILRKRMTSFTPLITSPIPSKSLWGPAYICHSLAEAATDHFTNSVCISLRPRLHLSQSHESGWLLPDRWSLHQFHLGLSEAPPTSVTISRKRISSSRMQIDSPIPSTSLWGPAYTCHSFAQTDDFFKAANQFTNSI
jgi:hypothetical protein